MFPEIHYSQNFSPSSGWMGPKFGQKMTTHFIFPNYNLDHQIPWGVDRGTAGSVNFDGPSMPSENCSSSCTSTTHAIGLVLVHTSPNNTPLRCLKEFCRYDFGVLPKWQGKTPKRHNRRLFSWIGPLPPMWGGSDTLGTLWKWIFLDFWAFFRNFMGLPHLSPPPSRAFLPGPYYVRLPNSLPFLEPIRRDSCDRSHLIYRQASLARAFGTGGVF